MTSPIIDQAIIDKVKAVVAAIDVQCRVHGFLTPMQVSGDPGIQGAANDLREAFTTKNPDFALPPRFEPQFATAYVLKRRALGAQLNSLVLQECVKSGVGYYAPFDTDIKRHHGD